MCRTPSSAHRDNKSAQPLLRFRLWFAVGETCRGIAGGGALVAGSRFVFLLLAPPGAGGGRTGVIWVLVSPNNRRLGQAGQFAATYQQSLDTVTVLRERHRDLTAVTGTAGSSGRWVWRVELDGAVVARCSRPYARQQECDHSLHRFLAAVPVASAAAGTRTVRMGRVPQAPGR